MPLFKVNNFEPPQSANTTPNQQNTLILCDQFLQKARLQAPSGFLYKDDLISQIKWERNVTDTLWRMLHNELVNYGPPLLETYTERHRGNILGYFTHIEEKWALIGSILRIYSQGIDEPIGPRFEIPENATGSKTYLQKASWSMKGRPKAEKQLKGISRLNQALKEDIVLQIDLQTGRKSQAQLANFLKSNKDAQSLEMADTLFLRTASRDITPGVLQLESPSRFMDHNVSSEQRVGLLGDKSTLALKAFRRAENFLIEYRRYTDLTDDIIQRTFRLVTFLRLSKPASMGVLDCQAVFHEPEKQRYGIALDLSKVNPSFCRVARTDSELSVQLFMIQQLRNLRSQLDTTGDAILRYSKTSDEVLSIAPISLNQRLQLAYHLAHTVQQILLCGWLHQDISSKNVWFIIDSNPTNLKPELGKPFLFGFQYARELTRESERDKPNPDYESLREDNLYRHPERQLPVPCRPHQKLDDIYSLGVVLLEIGTGKTARRLVASRKASEVPSHVKLLQRAKVELAERMGDTYAEIVVRCLEGKLETIEATDLSEEQDIQNSIRRVIVDGLANILKHL